MSAGTLKTRPTEYSVVLGGDPDISGVYENQRPEGVAIGNHKALVPIVVTCKKKEDAEAVNDLNHEIFASVKPNDYEGFLNCFKHQRAARQALDKHKRFHAIVYGSETGIWVDYEWSKLQHLVDNFRFPKYKGFSTLRDALIFMIQKEPYMSQSLPPPSPPKKILPGIRIVSAMSPHRTSPPLIFPSISAPFDPLNPRKDIPTPTVRFASPPDASWVPMSPGSSRSVSPTKARSRSTSPVKNASIAKPTNEFQQGRSSPVNPTSKFTQWIWRSLPEETRLLRSLMASDGPALTFGKEADEILRKLKADDEDRLRVLQARLYSINCDAFAFTLDQDLGWPEKYAEALWDTIQLPIW
ncbi:hypothetical protein L226DRAFT_520866 [Lentinus tigrinus ALCF2SS1-7]|uniref:uncharacterized protein n=1 Tax=Lentinus tigrinus ALCF2SS1-7 TaxID=1328758 RepID=UPI001165E350|nr:hypothetical protein L226DRAFT_520866 [Lentinus tigrinus ALCF2SS1-7]